MLASKNTLNYLTLLIPLSAFLYVSYSQAQQQSAQADATDSRRIERLGEVSTEEWEMPLHPKCMILCCRMRNRIRD